MDKFKINGGIPLFGDVEISGAKNAVLPIMAACIIKPGKYVIKNVPNLKDTRTMISLIKETGADIKFEKNILNINTTNCYNPVAPYNLVKTMRASFYMLGPFMSRFGKASVSLPGGCAWGPRPVNFHIEALKKMGAKIKLKDGNILCSGKLEGTKIQFEKKSVGATGNIIMAAASAKGVTEIENAACEPEIEDLCNFMIQLGVKIDGVGSENLSIYPMKKSENVDIEYSVIPDRIEAGTFMIAAIMTKGHLKLNNINPSHLKVVTDKIRKVGAYIKEGNSSIEIKFQGVIKPISIKTQEYPGFPTDLQAQWMALMCMADGKSSVIETIYKDRFTHISELVRFGADIIFRDNTAYISKIDSLSPAPVMSTDIRASASLILVALATKGVSYISRIYHIDRGYEGIEQKIKKIGGRIQRMQDTNL